MTTAKTPLELCGTQDVLDKLWELRTQGASWREIKEQTGLAQHNAQRAYNRQLVASREYRKELGANALEDHLAMVERIIEAHMPGALKGERYPTQFALQGLDQRAKLLGLYPKGDGNEGQGGTTINMVWGNQSVTVTPGGAVSSTTHEPIDSGDIVQGYLSPAPAADNIHEDD